MSGKTKTTPWWNNRAKEGTKAARLRKNAMLYCGATSLYWPLGRDIDSRLWPYAVACLEAVISLSDTAVANYARIVEAWELPGCKDIQKASLEHWPDTRAWMDRMARAYANKDALPDLPGLAATYAKYGIVN